MAILNLSFLRSLSFSGAETLLLQEGYVQEMCVEENAEICDKKFLYPYSLYDDQRKKLDCIYFIEYCNQVIDDEYIDGRMTWETIKVEWQQWQ